MVDKLFENWTSNVNVLFWVQFQKQWNPMKWQISSSFWRQELQFILRPCQQRSWHGWHFPVGKHSSCFFFPPLFFMLLCPSFRMCPSQMFKTCAPDFPSTSLMLLPLCRLSTCPDSSVVVRAPYSALICTLGHNYLQRFIASTLTGTNSLMSPKSISG